MSAKSKSAIPSTPNAKSSPATPRVSRVTRPSNDSVSSLLNGRNSVDRSPGSVTSKLKVDKLSPKPSTPTERKTTRLLRPSSELQAELNHVQEELKKANERLVLVEKEKAEALRLCDEANEKLEEAFLAQKRAEENSEIEKFRALEIEATNVKEDEWVKELEAVRNQHAVDVAALLSATQELQKVKQELTMTSAAKNQALSHADDATKIAEIHAEKVEVLSAEVIRLKAALESRVEMQAVESDKLLSDFKLEIDYLKQELEIAKRVEEKLADKEAALEKVNVDLEASKMAECYAHNLVEEVAFEAELARESERSSSESLRTAMKNMEESNDMLHDARSEILELKEKLGLMEIESEKCKSDLEESKHRLEQAKGEASEMAKRVESLESELEATREERSEALNNEKLTSANLQSLLEEKSKLVNELEMSREEEEKSKKALETLASALHEVSSEARDAKEKLITSGVECENYERQMEDLKLVLQSTNEKYECMLDDLNKQIVALTDSVEQSKHDYDNLKAELDQKELALASSVKRSEEEKSCLENELSKLILSVEQSKHDYENLKAELEQKELDLVNSVKKSEEEKSGLIETFEQSKHDCERLKAELEQKELDLVNSMKKSEEEKSGLIETLEQSKHDYERLKAELEQKELDLVNSVKKSEEEKSGLIETLEQSRHDYDILKAELVQKELDLVKSVNKSGEETSGLIETLEQSKHECDNLKAELEQKELDMLNSVKKSEEEKSHLENEVNRLLDLLKLAEEESSAIRDERDRWNKSFKEADIEAIHLKQALGEANEESARLKEGHTEMENQLQKILAENNDLRRKEAASQEKVEALSKSLEEALAKRQEEDEDLTDCEKDYDMLPKVVEFSEQNGKGDVRPTMELPIKENPIDFEAENSDDKQKDGEKNEESTEADLKMWESCKIDVKDFSPEREAEHESFDDELESKGEGGDLYDHVNGVSSTENLVSNGSPPSKSSSQKKKKPLLQKFGSLLKKKSGSNQKG